MVNDEAISAFDVERRAQLIAQTGEAPARTASEREAIRAVALNELIDGILKEQEAERVGVEPTDEQVNAAIADTDALIDGYVARRYALPMATVPPLIKSLALDIAIYKRHVYSPSDKIAEDYKAAIRSLEGISAGSVRLPIAGQETPGSGSSGARVTDRARPMTAANLKGFI